MTLSDYLDAMNLDLQVRRYHNQGERWTAAFDRCEEMEGPCFLASTYGQGHSPREAIEDYIGRVQGKRLCKDAMTERRREFVVPMNLRIEGDLITI